MANLPRRARPLPGLGADALAGVISPGHLNEVSSKTPAAFGGALEAIGGSSLALTITGLSKTYPNGVRALKNLSLTIGNLMFGLLGPNGAGKSSLMRTVATLQDPDTGTITLDGIDVLTQKDEVRKILGYLPQEFGVYPKLSALDMLHHLPC